MSTCANDLHYKPHTAAYNCYLMIIEIKKYTHIR